MNKYTRKAMLRSIRAGETKLYYENKSWTPKAERILAEKYLAGEDLSVIALLLQRTEDALMQKLGQMGLKTPVNGCRNRTFHDIPKSPRCLCNTCKVPDCPGASCPNYRLDEEE